MANNFRASNIAAGSEATPSLRFGGDATSGFFRPSADSVAFGAGASEVLRLAAAGLKLQSGKLFEAAAGTVGAPSVHFGDATTGFYRSGLNEISAAVDGVQKLKVSNSGINTSALDVTGAGAFGGNVTLTKTAAENTLVSLYNISAANVPSISFYRARVNSGLPDPTADGDTLGQFTGYGYGGTSPTYRSAAMIRFLQEGAPGTSSIAGRVTFWTSAVGASLVLAGYIKSTKEWHFGTGDTNYCEIDGNGRITFAGTGRAWRDEIGDTTRLKVVGSGIAPNDSEGTIDFADSVTYASDYAWLNIQLNHDRDKNAVIKPHVHWFQASSNHSNWLIQYRWQKNDGTAKTTSWTNLAATTTTHTYSSGTIMQMSRAADISVPSGTADSDIIQFRITRDKSNGTGLFGGADPLTGNAQFLSFDCHVLINCLGSAS